MRLMKCHQAINPNNSYYYVKSAKMTMVGTLVVMLMLRKFKTKRCQPQKMRTLLEGKTKYTVLPTIPSLQASTIPSKHSMINVK